MNICRRIKRAVRSRPVVRPGHVYTDHITGERFAVNSVGRWIDLERMDAERRPNNRVKKQAVLDAIDNGHVEHVSDTCPSCEVTEDV